MRTVRELTKNELSELKSSYVCEKAGTVGISYGELADSDSIPNQEIYDFYEGVCFTEDDFFCNQE